MKGVIASAEVSKPRERALLVGIHRKRGPRWEAEDSLEELARLAESAGAVVAGTILQERDAPDPRYLMGKGKAQEIKAQWGGKVDLLVMDEELSGSQQRNLEELTGWKTVDRPLLILDIFAQRARSREGKLQVELAQLDYRLPRLVGRGTALSRLGGGIGTRGPGETQLETDRRTIRRRMAKIREELAKVRRHRALLRKPRKRRAIPIVALVGYTNAGKSTLFNALTHSGVQTDDALFVTLDPILRPVTMADRFSFLLSDTVGFIRRLPEQLVAAFKATLEELDEADLLLHVIDASHPQAMEQKEAVDTILRELGLSAKSIVEVFNKVDLLPGGTATSLAVAKTPVPRVAVSAITGYGFDRLRWAVRESLAAVAAPARAYDWVPYPAVHAQG
ncbi:GTPase HflX [Candidatus Methylomirabilis lanthanidiphila]|uniref:GTPase HflX n=1 Tax=Candidatus Methylomirabilis lanthanidiphila TaxID=2211376 RepID=A0A564ZEX5_9BACT|nr:GTPase HflX [Candidatus Methylomirabilis lanthanidiphila]VUZ83875.1 GTPase HflX [Candidatus Methylomirabilis lanthanidiphila]